MLMMPIERTVLSAVRSWESGPPMVKVRMDLTGEEGKGQGRGERGDGVGPASDARFWFASWAC